MTLKVLVYALAYSLGVTIVIYAFPVIQGGQRDVGAIENIDGIPFPVIDEVVHIEEKLAHADIYLKEPVFAKQLTLEITFHPGNLKKLSLGVRENDFWLSYKKLRLYSAAPVGDPEPGDNTTIITKAITIPLTDTFQEPNRSIDLMFFATTTESTPETDEGIDDTTSWELHEIHVSVSPVMPSKAEMKNYVRSVMKRERAR